MAKRTAMWVTGLLLVAAFAAAACSGQADLTGGADDAGEGAGPQGAAQQGPPAGAPDARSDTSDVAVALLQEGVPAAGTRVVKTASLAIEVPDGRFDESFDDLALTAARHGGFVQSSGTEGSDRRSGSAVLRVPSESFERALAHLKALGKVEREEVRGEDVTARFVDLEARLRNWEAQEAVLLRLMRESTSIEDSITVQRNLQDVQLAIEQIRGQLRALEDQTEFGTISVSLAEASAPAAAGGSMLGRAWQRATEGFLAVVAGAVVALGYLVPLALVAGLAWLVYRRVRLRPRPRAAT